MFNTDMRKSLDILLHLAMGSELQRLNYTCCLTLGTDVGALVEYIFEQTSFFPTSWPTMGGWDLGVVVNGTAQG